MSTPGSQMTESVRFGEVVPPALQSIWTAAQRLGFGLVGIKGNNAHTFGAHLSQARLQGTGHADDYTLAPPPGKTNHTAAAAIDLGTGPIGAGPSWAGEWLEDVRRRCASGEIGFIGELIGDPDLIPGPASDPHVHLYSTAPDWAWVPYEGTGHVAWCHLWIRRDRLSDTGLGARLFQGWGINGREEDPVASSEVEKTVRAMTFTIPGHTYNHLDQILPALSGLVDRLTGPEFRAQLVAEVIAELKSPRP